MNKLLFVFLLVFTTACQQAPTGLDASPADLQTAIDARLTEYEFIKRDLADSTEGGEVNFYMDGEQVQKIEALRMGEMGQLFEQYYFNNGELDSAIIAKTTYNRPIYWDETMAAESGDTEAFDPNKSQAEESTYDYRAGDSSEEALHWKESAEALLGML